MKNKSYIIIILMLFITSAQATTSRTFKGKVKEGILDEAASYLASLPGVSHVEQWISDNQVTFVTRQKSQGVLKIKNASKAKYISVVPSGEELAMHISSVTPLASGRYLVGIFPRKLSDKPVYKNIIVQAGKESEIAVDFSRFNDGLLTLKINNSPANARVRIMNIKPKYTRNMRLAPGRYDVEVSAPGYKTQRTWITLSAKKTSFQFGLVAQSERKVERIIVTGSRIDGDK